MRKPGKRSMERNADFCSNCDDDNGKYFFNFLVGDFRERLVIPDKFEQHFRGLRANSVKLESRYGYTFDVQVAQNLGKLVLQTGWKAFVTAHDLNMGDVLVFKYDGTSRFKVLIFDLSCCEKLPPCLVKRNAGFCSNHDDDNDKYFFKVLVDDFRERLFLGMNLVLRRTTKYYNYYSFVMTSGMEIIALSTNFWRILLQVIPDKFEQHFRGLRANSVKLESRYGYTFDVQVAKNLGKLVLQTGWKAFVTAHDLNMGDFLVFKHDGTSLFKVLIFDLSCCEKLPPCLAKRNHIHGRERREEHIEISSSSEYLPMKSPGSKRKAWKRRKGSMNGRTSPLTSPPDTSGDSISSEDQNSCYVPGYILPQGTCLTSVQMKKLKEKVQTSTSAIPIYGCIMKKSNLRRGKSQAVDIPRLYAEEYLPFEEQTLMLQCCGKSWEVRCVIQNRKRNPGTKRLLKGWKQFACDNKLKLGDLCLFELHENTKYRMNVHVVRAK